MCVCVCVCVLYFPPAGALYLFCCGYSSRRPMHNSFFFPTTDVSLTTHTHTHTHWAAYGGRFLRRRSVYGVADPIYRVLPSFFCFLTAGASSIGFIGCSFFDWIGTRWIWRGPSSGHNVRPLKHRNCVFTGFHRVFFFFKKKKVF